MSYFKYDHQNYDRDLQVAEEQYLQYENAVNFAQTQEERNRMLDGARQWANEIQNILGRKALYDDRNRGR